MKKESAPCCDSLGTGEVKRRGFLGLLFGLAAGAVALATPVYAAVRAVIAPLKQQGISGEFYQLTTVDSLDTTPQKFPIVADIRDAWVTIPRQTIGNVYVRKNEKGEVLAWQSLCPHAGCTIGVKTMENPKTKNVETLFACPCHLAHFDLNGERLDEKPDAPRNMDSLEVKTDPDGKVSVRFEVFAFGTPEKRVS